MHLGVAAAQLQNLPGLVAWEEVNVCPAGPEDASDGADRLDAGTFPKLHSVTSRRWFDT